MGSATQKQISIAATVLITFVLTYQIIYSLSFLKTTTWPEIYLSRIAICLVGFFFSILGAWMAFRLPGGIVAALFASLMVFFVGWIARSSVYVWCLAGYAALCVLLFRIDQFYQNLVAVTVVDREKDQNEKNDLEISYKIKGEGISIFFEKYSTYYNLRKLAEELSTTLSVSQLAQIVVSRTTDFIRKGDIVLLTLADPGGKNLPVIASKEIHDGHPAPGLEGDFFDLWSVKNRKRLIVVDAHEDFRFDISLAVRQVGPRSLVIAPLLHEGHVIGTLRIHSAQDHAFTNDDLRVLDTIAVLASSALSNALLYEQTKELAIRDSLTGLFVQRYFYERLREEHRRYLLNQRQLSLLMCDLDDFKDCNDKFGHAVGDMVLVRFAEAVRAIPEQSMVVARYGGEEFAILLPETSKEEALKIAEQLRKTVETSPLNVRREKIVVTVSIGVANIPGDTLDADDLVKKADQALYAAKRAGKNRVCSNKS
ncbi:MAG: sensor domain-containing diguanylate cyclase [Candidatus Omnitrophica bacterium]|nr:sensor domain-containing diguanylate cyclase [Candidatus Omnitrophota bacterium]